MIIVDLNTSKNLEYLVDEVSKISEVNLIISLPNNVVLSFPGTIDSKLKNLTVTLPVLKNTIYSEVEGTCYLDLVMKYGAHVHKAPDTISFTFAPVVEIKLHEDESYIPSVVFREKKEVVIHPRSLELRPVSARYRFTSEEEKKDLEGIISFYPKVE